MYARAVKHSPTISKLRRSERNPVKDGDVFRVRKEELTPFVLAFEETGKV